MNVTKHDLSAGKTILNFPDLLKLAQIAVFQTRCEVERRLSELQNNSLYSSEESRWRNVANSAKYLAEAAKSLEFAAENLHVLTEAKYRDELEVINKTISSEKV